MNFREVSWIVVVALVLALPVSAAEVEHVANADTAEKFATVSKDIRHEMGAGGRYEFISSRDRAAVSDKLDAMAAILDKNGSVSAMSEADKTRLFNLQEQVNGALAQNASDRLICRNVSPVGSHIPVRTCRTYAEIVRNKRDAGTFKREIDNLQQSENTRYLTNPDDLSAPISRGR